MIPDPVDIIYCEVCELPHRRGVATCEECRHALGSPPHWERLQASLPGLRNGAIMGLAAALLLVISTGWLLGGAGYIVVVAPLTWAVRNLFQWRALSKRLAKRAGSPQRG